MWGQKCQNRTLCTMQSQRSLVICLVNLIKKGLVPMPCLQCIIFIIWVRSLYIKWGGLPSPILADKGWKFLFSKKLNLQSALPHYKINVFCIQIHIRCSILRIGLMICAIIKYDDSLAFSELTLKPFSGKLPLIIPSKVILFMAFM